LPMSNDIQTTSAMSQIKKQWLTSFTIISFQFVIIVL
jgi:hypothetical protein